MPFAVGAQGGGVDIEPFTTIKSYAPLCYWRMDEASGSLINSGSAASKNATVTNLTYGVAKIASRSPKNAITFNGTTNTAEVAAGVIGGVAPTFTVGAWIRTSASTGTDTIIAQRDGTNGNSGFAFWMDSGVYLGVQGVTTAGANDFSLLSEQLVTLNDGIPHFVSFTAYSDTLIIYCDGVEVGNSAGRLGGTWSAIPKIYLGVRNATVDRWDGQLSDVFITSQVLTQADHYKIWRNGMLNAVTPPGSNFLDATTISVPVASTTLTSFDLGTRTIEPPLEPNPSIPAYTKAINSGHSAWFKFTSTAAGDRLRINVVSNPASTAYHYLDVYKSTGSTITNLQSVATSVGYTTTATVIVEATTTYYARVRSYYKHATVIDLTYHYDTPPPPPANDNFANAILLDVTSASSIAGSTDGATIQYLLETDYWDTGLLTSVWYKFVAGATGTITLTDTSGNDSIIVAWVNCANIAQAETDGPIDGDQPALALAVTSGNTYHIQISDYANGQSFTLGWTTIV